MRIPVVTPAQLVDRAAEGLAVIARLAESVPRVSDLLGAIEQLVDRLSALAVRLDADELVARSVIDRSATLATRLNQLVDVYEPLVRAARPAIETATARLGPREVEAIADLVERGPQMANTFDNEVAPLVGTLTSVGPDLSDLLTVSRTLNEMLGAVPGLGRIKKRVDDEAENDTDNTIHKPRPGR